MGLFDKWKRKKKKPEELESIAEEQPERKNHFNYVGAMPDDVRAEIDRTFQAAVEIFKISNPNDGRTMASEIRKIVDDILETGKFPEEYDDMADVAVALGVLFGQALCCGHGWTWKVFGDSKENSIYGVVSPEENFCNAPMLYIMRILNKENIGLDGNNDNTVLLLYNMLENIDQKPESERYVPLA